MRWALVAAALAVGGLVLVGRIAKAHDGYEGWKRPDVPAASCCNEQDCAPLEPGQSYIDDGQYWITIEGPRGPVNCPVPPGRILDATKLKHIPPGNGHACILKGMWIPACERLLCFLPGVGG